VSGCCGKAERVGKFFIVGVGGFMGSIFRFWLAICIGRRMGTRFPYGTFVINVNRFTSDWLRHDGAHGDGMKHQGVLCRPHARRIRQMAPVRLHDACEEADRRNAAELNSELQDLLGRSSTGERSGAGCSDVRRNS